MEFFDCQALIVSETMVLIEPIPDEGPFLEVPADGGGDPLFSDPTGGDEGEGEGGEIVVTGKRPRNPDGTDPGKGDHDVTPGTGGGGGDGGGGGTGGGTGTPTPDAYPDPKETPCVEYSPGGAPLRSINMEALIVATKILSLNYEAWEYGSLVYTLDDQVYSTRIFTQQRSDQVGVPLDVLQNLPDRANVVGFVHNHTSVGVNGGEDQRIPSPADFNVASGLRDALREHNIGRGILVDMNMLIYVHGRAPYQGQSEAKTYVYDKGDEGDGVECSLQ